MAQLAKIAGASDDKITLDDPMAALELIAKQAETGRPHPEKLNGGSAFAELQELYDL